MRISKPSLAHPGGNVTGFTVADAATFGKLLEVLKEVAPHLSQEGQGSVPDTWVTVYTGEVRSGRTHPVNATEIGVFEVML